eukprot:g20852.t1
MFDKRELRKRHKELFEQHVDQWRRRQTDSSSPEAEQCTGEPRRRRRRRREDGAQHRKADLRSLFISHMGFQFAHAFAESVSEDEVYRHCAADADPWTGTAPVQHMLAGKVATVFMFGQTGSGKTHTMSGLFRRAAQHIFRSESSVTLTAFEIAGKVMRDLLDQSSKELKIREDKSGKTQILGLQGSDACHTARFGLRREVLPPGYRFVLLSLDTPVDDHYGNLDGSNWRIVLEFLRLGVTALGLTGPPCETFSAARYLPPPDGMRRPPRPLRSAKALWGIPDRIARELRQLAMGTRLLMHSQQAETMICLNGGMSAMERPKSRRREDCPDDAILPSSWDAYTQVHFLSHIPLCRFHQVEQWKYGADSVKPTTFRTIGMRNFAANLAKHADPHAVRPQMVLQGLNDKGDATLTLVDCAGSERREDATQHDARSRKDAAEINSTIFALKECFRVMRSSKGQPPYRESLLTRVLADSFGSAEALVVAIGTVSPAAKDTEHSIGTLRALQQLQGTQMLFDEREDVGKPKAEEKPKESHPKSWSETEVRQWLEEAAGGRAKQFAACVSKGTDGKSLDPSDMVPTRGGVQLFDEGVSLAGPDGPLRRADSADRSPPRNLLRWPNVRFVQLCGGDDDLGNKLYQELRVKMRL